MINDDAVTYYRCKKCGKTVCDTTGELPIWNCALCGAGAEMLEDHKAN
jgi:ribosomal protein L37AE/L43A